MRGEGFCEQEFTGTAKLRDAGNGVPRGQCSVGCDVAFLGKQSLRGRQDEACFLKEEERCVCAFVSLSETLERGWGNEETRPVWR